MRPVSFVYPSTKFWYYQNHEIKDPIRAITEEAEDATCVAVSLPTGLRTDKEGTITGIPTEISSASDYTIECTDERKVAAVVSIEIRSNCELYNRI